jgi:hypothetical protein
MHADQSASVGERAADRERQAPAEGSAARGEEAAGVVDGHARVEGVPVAGGLLDEDAVAGQPGAEVVEDQFGGEARAGFRRRGCRAGRGRFAVRLPEQRGELGEGGLEGGDDAGAGGQPGRLRGVAVQVVEFGAGVQERSAVVEVVGEHGRAEGHDDVVRP